VWAWWERARRERASALGLMAWLGRPSTPKGTSPASEGFDDERHGDTPDET